MKARIMKHDDGMAHIIIEPEGHEGTDPEVIVGWCIAAMAIAYLALSYAGIIQ